MVKSIPPREAALPFELQLRWAGDVAVLRCCGRLVAGDDVRALRAEVERLMRETRQVVLHLAEVTSLDSSGLGVIVRLLGSLRAAHGDLKLSNVPAQLRQVFQITNLLGVVQIFESDEDAVRAFAAHAHTTSAAPAAPKQKILCVDDNADVLACLRVLLQREGYEVHTTDNLLDAGTLTKAVRPGLVILGSSVHSPSAHPPAAVFTRANPAVPLLQLDSGFSTAEAGEAGAALVARVRSLLVTAR